MWKRLVVGGLALTVAACSGRSERSDSRYGFGTGGSGGTSGPCTSDGAACPTDERCERDVFVEARRLAAGPSPKWVELADANDDGHLDAIVVQNASSGVVTLLGHGDGTLRGYLESSLGRSGHDAALGDFNGDGRVDVHLGSVILLGDGAGYFRSQIPLDDGGHWVDDGDLDLDGDLDFVALDFALGMVRVGLGDGRGVFTFGAPFSPGTEGQLFNFALGDFDEDSVLDLAVVNISPGAVAVLHGNRDGTFDEGRSFATIDSTPFGILVADWNEDGHLDVVVGTDFGTEASLLLGTGDGAFQAARPVVSGVATGSFASGDFDGDGRLDLVTGHASELFESTETPFDAVISFHSGFGDGTFSTAKTFRIDAVRDRAVPYYLGLAAGDLDEDGRTDVVAASGLGGVLSVLISTPSGRCVPAR